MSDIFISYASDDRERVQPIVDALKTTGWSVFWDRSTPVGQSWLEFISAELDGCRTMVVVWSEASVESEWVLEEVTEAKGREILFPVFIDHVELPFGFRSIQAADLVGKSGAEFDAVIEHLIDELDEVLGLPPARSPGEATPVGTTQSEQPPPAASQAPPAARSQPGAAYMTANSSQGPSGGSGLTKERQLLLAVAAVAVVAVIVAVVAVIIAVKRGPADERATIAAGPSDEQGATKASEVDETVKAGDEESAPPLLSEVTGDSNEGITGAETEGADDGTDHGGEEAPGAGEPKEGAPGAGEPKEGPPGAGEPDSASVEPHEDGSDGEDGPVPTSADDDKQLAVITAPRGGVELLLIPAGTFMMGSAEGDEVKHDKDEEPAHEVELVSFYLARTSLTHAQYALYLEANPDLPHPAHWNNEDFNKPEQALVGVSWAEAQAYCEWAGLVLPTEAQWEYAARAGTTTVFWPGDSDRDLVRAAWFLANSASRVHAVAGLEANPFGLFDMHGNVWEWTRDNYGLYSLSPRPGDGLRYEPVADGYRVMRGGSWGSGFHGSRSANRKGHDPTARFNSIGFRPAMEIK